MQQQCRKLAAWVERGSTRLGLYVTHRWVSRGPLRPPYCYGLRLRSKPGPQPDAGSFARVPLRQVYGEGVTMAAGSVQAPAISKRPGQPELKNPDTRRPTGAGIRLPLFLWKKREAHGREPRPAPGIHRQNHGRRRNHHAHQTQLIRCACVRADTLIDNRFYSVFRSL